MNNRDAQILQKLLEESALIAELTEGLDLEAFAADERTKRAVAMTLINIGELVKGLSEELRKAQPQIPWRAIAGLRDVAAHRYQTLRVEDIWATAESDIPILRDQLAKLL